MASHVGYLRGRSVDDVALELSRWREPSAEHREWRVRQGQSQAIDTRSRPIEVEGRDPVEPERSGSCALQSEGCPGRRRCRSASSRSAAVKYGSKTSLVRSARSSMRSGSRSPWILHADLSINVRTAPGAPESCAGPYPLVLFGVRIRPNGRVRAVITPISIRQSVRAAQMAACAPC